MEKHQAAAGATNSTIFVSCIITQCSLNKYVLVNNKSALIFIIDHPTTKVNYFTWCQVFDLTEEGEKAN